MEPGLILLLAGFYNMGNHVMDLVGNGHEIYGIYQDLFINDLQPEIESTILDLKREWDFTMKDVWRNALTSDYKEVR